MRRAARWAPMVVLAAVAVVALAVGAGRTPNRTPAQRAANLSAQIRCPVCGGETVAESDTPISQQIRSQIGQEVHAGLSDKAILARLEAAYGSGILEQPPARGVDLLVWVLPVVAVAVAGAGLAFTFRRWRPLRGQAVPADDDLERVRQELESLE